jgi:hypothetical protein
MKNCFIGRRLDHKANTITFTGFQKDKEENSLYLVIELEKDNPTEIILTGYSWLVVQPITLKSGRFKGQLVEYDLDKNFIKHSDMFNVIIGESLNDGEEYELKDPILDLEYAKMQQLNNTIQTKLDNGEFIGEKGDKGDKGDKGYSNYELALQNGFVGTESEYLKSLEYTHSEEYQTLSNKMDNTYDKSVKVSSEFDDKAEKVFSSLEESNKSLQNDIKSFDENVVSKTDDFNSLNDELTKGFNDNYDSKKSIIDETSQNALDNINQKTSDFNALNEDLADKFNANYEEKKASVDEVKDEVDKAKEDIQDSIDGVAKEVTAQDILNKFNELNEMVRTISENSQNADSLNGFGFELLDDGSVMMTYTDEEAEEQTGVILPTETTLQRVLNATSGIRDSVLEIANKEEE